MKLAIRIIISFVIVLGGFLLFIFTSNDKLDPVIKENCFIRGNMIGESQKEINDADRNGFIIKDKTLVAYVGTKKNIVIPSSVNRIQADALAWDTCHAVMAKKITIPGSVKTIDNHSFAFVKADTIIFKEGIRIHSQGIILIFSPIQTKEISVRSAFIAGKKNGNAVWRNKAKRRMRALFNELSFLFNERDVIFLAKKNINKLNYNVLKDSLIKSLENNSNRIKNEKLI